jgi:hypothetical protein
VRIWTHSSSGTTKIFPSPTSPVVLVRAALTMAAIAGSTYGSLTPTVICDFWTSRCVSRT